MIWTHCGCGHRIEHHYMGTGTQRHGPCKETGCPCGSFEEKEGARPPTASASKSRSSDTG